MKQKTDTPKYSFREVSQDVAIILIGIGFAYILVATGVLSEWLMNARNFDEVGPFFAGMFFTSLLTTAPALVVLTEMAQIYDAGTIALFGAAGAVVGDSVIFNLVKDRFSEHLARLVRTKGSKGRLKQLVRFPVVRWFTFLIGGLIIASPLPDELGIGLLGFSKMKVSGFITISFIFNFIGIYLIATAAQIFF